MSTKNTDKYIWERLTAIVHSHQPAITDFIRVKASNFLTQLGSITESKDIAEVEADAEIFIIGVEQSVDPDHPQVGDIILGHGIVKPGDDV